MIDIVLRDADAALVERIQTVADAHGWNLPQALSILLEHGLRAVERPVTGPLDSHESDALSSALDALEQMPDDQGYALIGRLGAEDKA